MQTHTRSEHARTEKRALLYACVAGFLHRRAGGRRLTERKQKVSCDAFTPVLFFCVRFRPWKRRWQKKRKKTTTKKKSVVPKASIKKLKPRAKGCVDSNPDQEKRKLRPRGEARKKKWSEDDSDTLSLTQHPQHTPGHSFFEPYFTPGPIEATLASRPTHRTGRVQKEKRTGE